jgi:hypothetical protein
MLIKVIHEHRGSFVQRIPRDNKVFARIAEEYAGMGWLVRRL